MRPRGSITGPVIVILVGIIFLIHAVTPSLHVGDLIAWYWPYVLIAWGAIAFLEISFRALQGKPLPVNGISGGGWMVIILICAVGLVTFEFHRPGGWWQRADWSRGFSEAFGEEHDYSIDPVERTVGDAPHIIIEAFRGDAKVVTGDGTTVSVSGHKSIRAMDAGVADRANSETPVEVQVQGHDIVIRCNQDRADSRTRVTTDLDITLPKGASLQATSNHGDFDISGLAGDVDLTAAAATVRVQDVAGSARINVSHSDGVSLTDVKGTVDIKGNGSDISLLKIGGQVAIGGDFRGTVSLKQVAKPVRFEGMRTHLEAEQIPGNVEIDRGSFDADGLVGPIKLTSHASDITLAGFTNAVELTLDRGDIELRPGRVPLGKMIVRDNSGNIELNIPSSAQFVIAATTNHGDIDNEFGGDLRQESERNSTRLNGAIGSGPELNVTTGRGTITIKKVSLEATVATTQ